MSSSSQIRRSNPYAEGYLSLAPDLKPNDPHQQWLVDRLKEIDERQDAPYALPCAHTSRRCGCHYPPPPMSASATQLTFDLNPLATHNTLWEDAQFPMSGDVAPFGYLPSERDIKPDPGQSWGTPFEPCPPSTQSPTTWSTPYTPHSPSQMAYQYRPILTSGPLDTTNMTDISLFMSEVSSYDGPTRFPQPIHRGKPRDKVSQRMQDTVPTYLSTQRPTPSSQGSSRRV